MDERCCGSHIDCLRNDVEDDTFRMNYPKRCRKHVVMKWVGRVIDELRTWVVNERQRPHSDRLLGDGEFVGYDRCRSSTLHQDESNHGLPIHLF